MFHEIFQAKKLHEISTTLHLQQEVRSSMALLLPGRRT